MREVLVVHKERLLERCSCAACQLSPTGEFFHQPPLGFLSTTDTQFEFVEASVVALCLREPSYHDYHHYYSGFKGMPERKRSKCCVFCIPGVRHLRDPPLCFL
eukprot:RCo045651